MLGLRNILQSLSNMRLLNQLVITFSVILIVNIFLGIYFTTKIRSLKSLVEVMYDKPLMASTYAMSAKYRFERADALMRTVFFETAIPELVKLKKEINSQLEQGIEDLKIVQERAFADSSKQIADRVQSHVDEYKKLIDTYLLKVTDTSLSGSTASDPLSLLHEYLAIDIRNSIQKDLTDLTDDAAETGYTFRLDSEVKNSETVRFFYAGSALMLLVIIGSAILLTRTIARPLSKYSETCQIISEGDYSKRVRVFGEKSEIAVLGNSFNTMIDKVVEKDQNMKSLLDGLPTGVFSFDEKTQILPEKSNACQEIFGNYRLTNMIDFLNDFSQLDKNSLKDSIAILWDKNIEIDFDDLIGVLPGQISLAGVIPNSDKIISLKYKQNLSSSGHLENVIVMAEDITAKLELEKNSVIQAERVERMTKASLSSENYIDSKNNFINLIRDCKSILKNGISKLSYEDVIYLKRQLHSLKGELALMAHKSCAEQVHHMESSLIEELTPGLDLELIAAIEKIETEFRTESSDVLTVLGLDENTKSVKVNVEKIQQLLTDIETTETFSLMQKNELTEKLSSLLQKPLQSYFQKYETYVQETAIKLGKLASLVFDSSSSEVTFTEVQNLDFILGHLIRNSLDHGIEAASDREKVGKPAIGQIKIAVHRLAKASGLEFIISDDGQGIDHQKLIDKALKKELWTEQQARVATRQQALDLIFKSDFSTKDVVTDTSGRGVGLDAVRSEVEKLGGSITLETSIGHGTKFTIRLS